MKLNFADSQSYKNGRWLPFRELTWSVTDFGTTQGAMLVERLRTFDGKLVDVDDHLSRLAHGAEILGIPLLAHVAELKELCDHLVRKNRGFIDQQGDLGLVLLISPGDPGVDCRETLTPTILGHVSPLPFSRLLKWYQFGADLHFSTVRNVPAECWSPSIKTRSRLQYYLADHRDNAPLADPDSSAIEKAWHSSRKSNSIAVLLSTNGYVTETSISNLLVLGKDGVLRSPPLKDILWGVSLKTVCELAKSIDQPVEFADLHPSAILEAKEILMTGSTGCLWSAVSVEGRSIGDGRPGLLCKRLQEAWQQKIGFSFMTQAIF